MQFNLRLLKEDDFLNGFFDTLSNLSEIGDLNKNSERIKEIFKELSCNKNFKIIVAEDKENLKIIGTATLFIEQKFIHDGGKVGHIEDVAIKKGFQNKGLGKEIIKELIEIAKEENCYKVILDCDEKVSRFYEKIGFKRHSIMMRINI
ncbi:MAG TPA: GNAT family N-acetyltransferase [Verrucomicrobiae bacterium]|nr:GNAT family N-acetyltransferase [Verrucomicrobiae bacterium]